MKELSQIITLIIFALGLVACGGGGGGGSTNNTPPVTRFDVTTSVGANGSINPTSASVVENTVTVFTLIPDAGFVVDSVSGCGTGTTIGNTYTTGLITADCTVTVGFIADVTPPTATITFPPPNSYTEDNNVIVHGTASDDGQIASVTVNGVNATSSDNFANWEATVNLTTGSNALSVDVTDEATLTTIGADSAQIRTASKPFPVPQDVVLDSANDRALVVDGSLDALIAIDLTSGEITTISENTNPGGQPVDFVNPQSVALDSANNRAFVLDFDQETVVEVNLGSGARSVFSNISTPNADNPFDQPFDMVLDSGNNRLLVTDFSATVDALIAVAIPGGARTVISNDGTPDSVNNFLDPLGLALDSVLGKAVVVDATQPALVSVDFSANGARTIVSNNTDTPGGTNPFVFPIGIALTSSTNALVIDAGTNDTSPGTLFSVDLSDGTRSIVSDGVTPDAVNAPLNPTGIDLDSANNQALVVDATLDTLIAIDLNSGVRRVIPDSSIPDTTNPLIGPIGIVFDDTGNRFIVIDNGRPALVNINADTGARTIVSDNTNPGGQPVDFINPAGIAFVDTNSALVIDSGNNSLMSVNLANGTRSIISNNTFAGPPFSSPVGTAYVDTNTALVLDAGTNALLSVNLMDGSRTIVSDNTMPDATNSFVSPTAVTLINNTTALVADNALDTLISVDLTTGARTIVSSSSVPNAANAFDNPTNVTLKDIFTALVTDRGLNAVVSVDLTNGARSIVSNINTPDSTNMFAVPSALAYDSTNNQVLVTDSTLNAVIAATLSDGHRVFLSR